MTETEAQRFKGLLLGWKQETDKYYVVLRTRSGRVHAGQLASCNGEEVELTAAKRLQQWDGAKSIHRLSIEGTEPPSEHVSEEVARILLTDVVEVIPCTQKARDSIEKGPFGKI